MEKVRPILIVRIPNYYSQQDVKHAREHLNDKLGDQYNVITLLEDRKFFHFQCLNPEEMEKSKKEEVLEIINKIKDEIKV